MSTNFASSLNRSAPPNNWMIDSGASRNLTADLNNLSIHSEYNRTDEVQIADGSSLPITHTVTLVLFLLILQNILFFLRMFFMFRMLNTTCYL